jgi:hypothetical protein
MQHALRAAASALIATTAAASMRRLATRCAAGKRPRAGGKQSGGGEPLQQQPSPQPAASTGLARSVRAMPIKIISVSKANSPGAVAATEEWMDKLR